MPDDTKTIFISPRQDFLERISNATSINAVSELIWNGLDAGADLIRVNIQTDCLNSLETIEIYDTGSGITAEKVDLFFGDLGASWKRKQNRNQRGRALHGKNGEGRFKAFALGCNVVWETTYLGDDNQYYTYSITGKSSPTLGFTYTLPAESMTKKTGTRVLISGINKAHGSLVNENVINEFAKIFSNYLCKNPDITLEINGKKLNPIDYLTIAEAKDLRPLTLKDGSKATAKVEIIEWKTSIDREINLCDASGIELHSIEAKLKAKGYNFTIHIKSDYFRELDKENRLLLEELDPVIRPWVMESREFARGYFRQKKAAEQREIVQGWKDAKIYPYTDKDYLTPVEIAERQVFDIIGVSVEDYLPNFENADLTSKKFTFSLLAQAIKNNPESLQTIITEVLNLKEEQQRELAELLTKTDLRLAPKTGQLDLV